MEFLRRAREERHVLGVAAAALVSVDNGDPAPVPPPHSQPPPGSQKVALENAAASGADACDDGGSASGSPPASAMLECSALLAVLRLALGVDPDLRDAAVGPAIFRLRY